MLNTHFYSNFLYTFLKPSCYRSQCSNNNRDYSHPHIFHKRVISSFKGLYMSIFSSSFSHTLTSPGIATSMNPKKYFNVMRTSLYWGSLYQGLLYLRLLYRGSNVLGFVLQFCAAQDCILTMFYVHAVVLELLSCSLALSNSYY